MYAFIVFYACSIYISIRKQNAVFFDLIRPLANDLYEVTSTLPYFPYTCKTGGESMITLEGRHDQNLVRPALTSSPYYPSDSNNSMAHMKGALGLALGGAPGSNPSFGTISNYKIKEALYTDFA